LLFIYFVIDSVQKLLDTPSYLISECGLYSQPYSAGLIFGRCTDCPEWQICVVFCSPSRRISVLYCLKSV